MDTQGSIASLLTRLTIVLVNEALLLGGVRGEVEFIKDELECMNSCLLQLTEAQHRNHQVRTWMKQVVELTHDCEGNIELYVHYVRDGLRGNNGKGILGYFHRMLQFLCTIRVRHRIAMRIRELKVRAHDVGERRLRYGVIVPSSGITGAETHDGEVPSPCEEELRRHTILDGVPPNEEEAVNKGIEILIKRLSEASPSSPAAEDDSGLRISTILGDGYAVHLDDIAHGVYTHPSVDSSFDCKAWVNISYHKRDVCHILADILKQLTSIQPGQEDKDEGQLTRILQGYLKGKRFLIVLEDVRVQLPWEGIKSALLHPDGFCPGSAIITTTNNYDVARSSSPDKIINAEGLLSFFFHKVGTLALNSPYFNGRSVMPIFEQCYPNDFAMKMFLHLLYVNPNRTGLELRNYYFHTISKYKRLNRSISQAMVMFCYNELASKYRSCLLYLAIFPVDHVTRTTSLARRLIAEGLVTCTERDGIESAMDEAENYLDVLVTRGFVSPVEISAAGNIKSCKVHQEVHEFIANIARDVNLVNMNLPPEVSHHLSIHTRIELQNSHSEGCSNDIIAFLPTLAASTQWRILKVLDLEGCRGMKKNHLKSICKILLLRYLSLRNTDVTELPNQIKELQCLETLDIRETKVPVLARKAIVLPLLKYFFAGQKIAGSSDTRRSGESFPMVRMPLNIERMKNLEILSHFLVTNSDSELAGISQLLKLRKFGVALHGKNAKLNDLFHHIGKLHRSLHSLKIRIDQLAVGGNHDASTVAALMPPRFIKSLNISGLTSGLPNLIQELHQLAKLTLTETYLNEDDLRILGKLHGLRCLRLQHKSYTKNEISLKEEEFETLNFLLVGSSNITNISFVPGSAPKLERIVWSFPTTACLNGIEHLHGLKEFELNGECKPDQVRHEVERHINLPVFKYNPQVQQQFNTTYGGRLRTPWTPHN